MKTEKKLGIWMDHSHAHLMELAQAIHTLVVNSAFTHEAKVQSLERGENVMHHREQHEQAAYYKELGEHIKNYSEVLLFGPTEAKDELFNLLKSDRQFEHVKIEVSHAGKMTAHKP